MPTKVAFHTPPGAAIIPTPTRVLLGTVDIHEFTQMRVLVVARPGFTGQVTAILEYAILPSVWTPAWLDVIHLAQTEQEARIYAVPGVGLNVYGDASGVTSGTAAIDVLVFGAT